VNETPRRDQLPLILAIIAVVGVAAMGAYLLGTQSSEPESAAAPVAKSPTRTVIVRERAAPRRTPKPRSAATTPAQPSPAATAAQFVSWPAGTSAHTIVLRSATTRAAAEATAARAVGVAQPPGVLWSSDHASLRPGYWVAFTGTYATRDAAAADLPVFRAAGFPSAYVRRVADDVAPTVASADASSFHTGRDAGEGVAAAHCRQAGGELRCWTPNDGFTVILDGAGARRDRGAEAVNRGAEPAAPELARGESWAQGGFSCSSDPGGLTCSNGDGRGFSLPRYRGLPRYF